MKRLSIIAAVIALLGCGQPESQQAPAEVLPPAASLAETEATSVARGVVVEEVPEVSALAKAGIQTGDLLLSWKRLPNPPANPKPAEGALDSPFDFHDLRIEQAPRGAVELSGQREGVEYVWKIELGSWQDVEVEPVWPGEHLELYRQGKEQIGGGNQEDRTKAWLELAARLTQEGESRHSLWILYRSTQIRIEASPPDSAFAEDDVEPLILPRDRIYSVVDYAYVLQEIGEALKRRGKLSQARDSFVQALEAREQLDPQSLKTADALTALGRIARLQGQLKDAHGYYYRAHVIVSEAAEASVPAAIALNNLAIIARAQWDLDEAERLSGQALLILSRLAPGGLEVSGVLNNLGNIAGMRGNMSRARELHHQALRIREALSPESLETAASLMNMANILEIAGDRHQAFASARRALRIQERFAAGSRQIADTLATLGRFARNSGYAEQAQDYFLRATRIYEEVAPDSLALAYNLQNFGNSVFNLDHAEDLYSRSLRIKGLHSPDSPAYATSLHSLGTVAQTKGNLDQAEKLYHRALKIKMRHKPDSISMATTLASLGALAEERGNLDQAQVFHLRALGIQDRLGPDSLSVAFSKRNLGVVAHGKGHLSQARDYFQEALQIQKRLAPGSLEMAATLMSLGDLAALEGSGDQAIDYYLQATDTVEIVTLGVRNSYEDTARFRSENRRPYLQASQHLVRSDRLAEAFHLLERFRARTFLVMLAERDVTFTKDVPKELVRDRQALSHNYNLTVKRMAQLGARQSSDDAGTVQKDLETIDRKRREIEQQIRRTSPRLAALQYPKPLTAEAAQELLDPGTLLLSYLVGEESTWVFALTREGSLAVKTSPVGEKSLRRQIESMRRLIAKPPTTRLGQARARPLPRVSRELFNLLLAPLAERIEKSERLLIMPDGPLHALPFAALLRENGSEDREDQYLVEWKPFHLALSMTSYAELKKDRPAAREPDTSVQLAAFGDPFYPQSFILPDAEARAAAVPPDAVLRSVAGRDLEFDWFPLPYTRREVEGIAELFPPNQVQTFLGPEALEERIKTLDSGTRILHLAAHAFADDHLPLSSFVALTIPEDLPEGRENGLLQAWEILEQVRIKADLVVLSGCLTGMGQELRGEGMIGLTRAFHYAGARSLISTLWNVNDQVTAELMIRFYRHLNSGLPKDEALRAAQLQMLREPISSVNEKGEPVELVHASHPASWAGVQLYGDWR